MVINLTEKADMTAKRLTQQLKAVKKSLAKNPMDLKLLFQRGYILYQLEKYETAKDVFSKAIEVEPNFAEGFNARSIVNHALGKFSDAIYDCEHALSINPKYKEALLNLARAQQELHQHDEALNNYTKAIDLDQKYFNGFLGRALIWKTLNHHEKALADLNKAVSLNPSSNIALLNRGAVQKALGRLDESLADLQKAIALQPDLAEAHNNLGNTLQELARLDEAEKSYIKAIELQPNYAEAQNNLVELLTVYISQKETAQPIVKADQEIKAINLKKEDSGAISNDEVIDLFNKSSKIIKKHNLDLRTNLSQVYRRNSVHLNCKRHKQIFDEFNVIPKFCFGCYKVQVEPRSVLELVKLFVVFDQIKLSKNNTRKCMIETRPETPGFYKGLIYCSSLEEAYQIADYLEMVMKLKIGLGLPLSVKRGCSEYSIAFPNYKEINKSGPQLMNYNEDWKLVENHYDSLNSIQSKKLIMPSLSCFSLNDVLIIRNWIDYAKGIGDPSARLLNQCEIISQQIYETAKTRAKVYL